MSDIKQKAREMFEEKLFNRSDGKKPQLHKESMWNVKVIFLVDQIIDLAIAEERKRVVEMIETIHTRHYSKTHFNPKENREHRGYRKCEVDIIRELTNTNK